MITIPDPTKVRITHDYDHKPGVAKVAITAPGPLSVSATGTTPDGSALFEASVAANRVGYIGYCVNNAIPINRGVTAVRDTVISGFAGVVPQSPVFIADDGTLTHTIPTGLTNADRIGVGFTATMIAFN